MYFQSRLTFTFNFEDGSVCLYKPFRPSILNSQTHRHDLFMRARQEFGISKCWSRDGNIYVVGQDGSRHSISRIEDLSEINLPQTTAMPTLPSITSKEQQPTTRRMAAKK
ncbi:hypothetical protein K1T71_013213 [Dendrolimus kikuchii]|uniref:Uncharacterized protein n=1 Tax=Dendrolimus kikuchii TaxID=765133 RepID=A0ACC1CHG4_9NEOP|nr:hypothetical protein K1T71_013213 [Dendrolimus kikuchii]